MTSSMYLIFSAAALVNMSCVAWTSCSSVCKNDFKMLFASRLQSLNFPPIKHYLEWSVWCPGWINFWNSWNVVTGSLRLKALCNSTLDCLISFQTVAKETDPSNLQWRSVFGRALITSIVIGGSIMVWNKLDPPGELLTLQNLANKIGLFLPFWFWGGSAVGCELSQIDTWNVSKIFELEYQYHQIGAL